MAAMLVRHEPSSVAMVRRTIAADLAKSGVAAEVVDDVTLVASELVGNAVRHTEQAADGALDIAWTISPTDIVVSVIDASSSEPRMRTAAEHDTAGRGMTIVNTLASTWGVERLGYGKRVWAQVPIASVRQSAHYA